MNRLVNKVTIITGSAGGQGRAAALLFAQEGAKVVVADIKADGAKETVAMIKEKGGKAFDLAVDLGEPEQVQNLVQATLKTYGRIDVLYNNASRTRFAPLHEMSLEDWTFVLTSEITTTFLCCKYVIPQMCRTGGGSIINVSTRGAIVGIPDTGGNCAHGAAKAAIIGLTKNLAIEYAPYKIRANVICPGVIETPATTALLSNPKWLKTYNKRCPLGRVGKPEDIAPLALYLASDESSYVTGAIFMVDGGWTAQ